jgi:hypothetical protein
MLWEGKTAAVRALSLVEGEVCVLGLFCPFLSSPPGLSSSHTCPLSPQVLSRAIVPSTHNSLPSEDLLKFPALWQNLWSNEQDD